MKNKKNYIKCLSLSYLNMKFLTMTNSKLFIKSMVLPKTTFQILTLNGIIDSSKYFLIIPNSYDCFFTMSFYIVYSSFL